MTRTDGKVLLAMAAFALLYQLLAWNGATPYVFLSGDAANNASIAAAMDHPELFRGDALLGDPGNFRFYRILHLPLLRLLAPLVGDYGTPHHLLLFPHLLLHLAGFYLLGLLLLKNRFWAAVAAFLLLAPIHVNMGEFWGVHRDSLARNTFQALLPWVLCLALLWRERPGRWPLIMIAAGLLMGVHAVSTPSWGLALWLGFVPFLPRAWGLLRKLGWMLLQGLVFLAAAAPIALNYLAGHAHGAETGGLPQGGVWAPLALAQELLWERKYAAVRQAWLERFQTQLGLLDLGAALRGFFTPGMILLVLTGLGAALAVRRIEPRDRPASALVLTWLGGILLVSVGLTGLEQLYCRLTHSVPVEMNLVRGLRFTIPIMLLFVAWALCRAQERLKVQGRGRRRGPAPQSAVGMDAVVGTGDGIPPGWGWVGRNRLLSARILAVVAILAVCGAWFEELEKRTRDLRDGHILTMTPEQRDLTAGLDFLRLETPAGSLVLPVGEDRDKLLAVRYYGLRPVVYAWKDGGVLGYADNDKMLAWYDSYLRWSEVAALGDPAAREAGWAALARDLGAAYVFRVYVEDEPRAPLPGAEAVFARGSVVVFRLE